MIFLYEGKLRNFSCLSVMHIYQSNNVRLYLTICTVVMKQSKISKLYIKYSMKTKFIHKL